MISPGFLEQLFSLDAKAAIVTGAARGNGRALAEALLRAGAGVLLVDVLQKELAETVETLKGSGLQAVGYACDLSAEGEPTAVKTAALAAFGRIDVLVNNAGITMSMPTLDYSEEAWMRTYEVNLKVPFQLSRAVAAVMRVNGGGSIINITSINAELAFPDNPAYVTFKGALKQLSKALALDLAKYGVRVNCIGPGYFRTDMTKKSYADPVLHEERRRRTILGRWGEPDDLAGAVIFLASKASSYVTGADLYVDGGWLVKGL